ncbi:MAG: BrnT family toxin [Terriglobia bacterium]
MEFEWDASKAAKNLRKHKVSFHEAATVFGDFLSTTAADPAHSAGEHRYITVGMSNSERLLMVAHAERGGRIRIISARTLSGSERRAYEDTQK